jgi:putative DNA primase/helicase
MELADAPAWLLELLVGGGRRNGQGAPAEGRIPEGQRKDALTSFPGSMRHRGMCRAAIEAALLVENAERCDPPLTQAEVRRIAGSVARCEPATAQPHLPL